MKNIPNPEPNNHSIIVFIIATDLSAKYILVAEQYLY